MLAGICSAKFLQYGRCKNVCLSIWNKICSASFTSERQFNTDIQGDTFCYKLNHRALVRVQGTDGLNFLQGLITNDTKKLQDGSCVSLSAYFLNLQGRILYDCILYMTGLSENPTILIECDQAFHEDLLNHMKKYKIRKKVDLSLVGSEHQVWSIVPKDPTVLASQTQLNLVNKENILSFSIDPRVNAFGWRIVLNMNTSVEDVVMNSKQSGDMTSYHSRRYMLGMSEGGAELPIGKANPLESNGVFQNTVCFQKGCYIGQELTARTHHTGVIRKRLMPLKFMSEMNAVSYGNSVETNAGKTIGKIYGVAKQHGLGLLRLQETLKIQSPLFIKGNEDRRTGEATYSIPFWWNTATDSFLSKILQEPKASKT